MKTNSTVHKFLALLLTFCLVLPATAMTALADGKSGKKSFQEGLKHEAVQQWDLAAQEFALALAADPTNVEYKLHYGRALQNASVMFVKRGDELAKQGDYASAYNAFRQASGYDPGNEMASLKMRSMLEMQKDQGGGGTQYRYTPNGNLKPINNDIVVASKPRSRDTQQDIIFKDIEFKECIKNLSRSLDLNVLFDESVRVQGKIQVELRGVTMAKAFDLVLLQNKMTFEQVDRKTIIVFADNAQTKQKFEKAVVKTFYLGNIKTSDARNVIQSLMPGRPVGAIDDQKMLVLKGTPAELQLVQDMLDAVDKNVSEVVIDVEIFEVSHNTANQIGNQLATSPVTLKSAVKDSTGNTTSPAIVSAGLTALGGVGLALSGIQGAGLVAGLNGSNGAGALLGVPPTTLSLLQSANNSKLLARTQIHALDNQQNQTKVGQSVPVSLGQNYGNGFGYPGVGTTGTTGGITNPTLGGGLGLGTNGLNGGLFNNIQYKDVGLVIDVTPKITNEGYVEIKMKLETTDIQGSSGASSSDQNLTPRFTQRSLSTTSRIQDGVTSVVASVSQERRNDGRSSIPVVGMLPILGRLFTTPNVTRDNSDIIITVTPHIVRATEITKEDNLARAAGPVTNAGGGGSGIPASIEDVLNRAQQEDEQERRMVAQSQGVPVDPTTGAALAQTPAQIAPGAPSTVPAVRNVNNPGGPLPDRGLPAGPSGSANTFQPVNNTNDGKPARKPIIIQGDPNSPSSNNNPPPPQPEAQTMQADTTPVPPVEPNPVMPDPAALAAAAAANGGVNPTLPGAAVNPTLPNGGVNPNMAGLPNGGVNPTLPGGAANPNGAPGEKTPDISENQQPEVRPAQVMGAMRPPSVEKYIQEQRLKALKEQEEAKKNARQPVAPAPQPELAPAGPRGGAAPAAPRAVMKPGGLDASGAPTPQRMEAPKPGTLAFSLNPAQPSVSVNKSVLVTLQLDAQSALSAAGLVLRYDSAKLQVKAVRDGDVLGRGGDLTHSADNGVLTINATATNGRATKAAGRLLVVEFVALAEGPTEIVLDPIASQVKLPGNVPGMLTATPAQLTITK